MKCFANLTFLIHQRIRFLYKQAARHTHTGLFTNTSSCPFVPPTHIEIEMLNCVRLNSLKWLQPKEATDKIHSEDFIHRHWKLEDFSEDISKARVVTRVVRIVHFPFFTSCLGRLLSTHPTIRSRLLKHLKPQNLTSGGGDEESM